MGLPARVAERVAQTAVEPKKPVGPGRTSRTPPIFRPHRDSFGLLARTSHLVNRIRYSIPLGGTTCADLPTHRALLQVNESRAVRAVRLMCLKALTAGGLMGWRRPRPATAPLGWLTLTTVN